MAVTTADAFFAVLGRSGIFAPDEFASLRSELTDRRDGMAVARALLSRNRLTEWQALQLLNGRYGLRLGNYQLLRQLGSGPFGKTFLAEHLQMGRQAVLKTLRRRHVKSSGGAENLLPETRALAALDHRNIARIYDVGRQRDRIYIVSEHIDGADLAELVRTRFPLPLETAGELIRQAALGLAHAHGHGIVHGAIKPSNLMVDEHGDLKVVDLGLSGLTQQDESDAHTIDADLSGIVDYLSPEQAEGEMPAEASDIYSLGCVLFFLVTGSAPYPEGSPAERLRQHVEAPSPRPLAFRPDTPAALEKICAKMMAKSPVDRYSSAEMVAEVIDVWLADQRQSSETIAMPAETIAQLQHWVAERAAAAQADSSSTQIQHAKAWSDSSATQEPDLAAVELLEDSDEPLESVILPADEAPTEPAEAAPADWAVPKGWLIGGAAGGAALLAAIILLAIWFWPAGTEPQPISLAGPVEQVGEEDDSESGETDVDADPHGFGAALEAALQRSQENADQKTDPEKNPPPPAKEEPKANPNPPPKKKEEPQPPKKESEPPENDSAERQKALAVPETGTPSINYWPSFDGGAALMKLVGHAHVREDAALGAGERLRLTDNHPNRKGSAWFHQKQPVSSGFTTTFAFQFSAPVKGGADGIAFVVHNTSKNAQLLVDESGATDNGLNITFDSWKNEGQPSHAFVAIRAGTRELTVADLASSQGIEDFSGGAIHRIRIDYVPGSLTVYVGDDAVVERLDVDLADIGAVDAAGAAWVGFGSRTTGAPEHHDILAWSLNCPFRDFPTHVELPEASVRGGEVQGTEEAALGRIYRGASDVSLELLGSDTAYKVKRASRSRDKEDLPAPGGFAVQEAAPAAFYGIETFELVLGDEAGRWQVRSLRSRRPDGPPVVAELSLSDEELKFRWTEEGAKDRIAGYLRNSKLRISTASGLHEVRLRQPIHVEPLYVDLDRSANRAEVELDWAPDPLTLSVEITDLAGDLPDHLFDPSDKLDADRGMTWIRIGGEAARLVDFRIESTMRTKLMLTATPFVTMPGESAAGPFNKAVYMQRSAQAVAALRSLTITSEQLERLNPKKQKQKEELDERKKEVKKQLEEVSTLVKQYDALRGMQEQVGEKTAIHYRVLFDTGREKVVLAESRAGAAGK